MASNQSDSPGERTARRWSAIALVVAAASVAVSAFALSSGVGVVLALVAVVVAVWVRLGLAPYSRRVATTALVVSGAALALHLLVYTATLLQ